MSETTPPQTVRDASRETDLSAEIIDVIDRTVGERVTCRKISGSKYRCNWWAQSGNKQDNPGMSGLLVTTHVVSRSRFLSVVRNEHGLTISDVPQPSSR